MGLDPALEALLRAEGALKPPDLGALPLPEALALLRRAKPPAAPPPGEAAAVEDRDIPGPDGHAIPVRILPAAGIETARRPVALPWRRLGRRQYRQ